MALTNTTLQSNFTAPVNYVLMTELLKAARKVLPYFNGTLPGTLEKKQGSASVKWRRVNNLATATTPLAEVATSSYGQGRSSVQATITDVTVAVQKYGNLITTTEELDLINVNSDSLAIMDVLGANAGESLNTLMATVFDAGTNTRYSAGVASDAVTVSAFTVSDGKYIVNQLNRESAMKFMPLGFGSQNVGTTPVRNSYIGICHSDVEEDIRALTGFSSVETYGGYTQTMPGEFGALNGVRWVSTEMAPVNSGAGTTSANGFRGGGTSLNDVYSSFIYGREAVGSIGLGEMHAKEIYKMYDRVPTVDLIRHGPGTSGVADPYNEAGTLAWKSWFAGKILNNSWIWAIHSLSASL